MLINIDEEEIIQGIIKEFIPVSDIDIIDINESVVEDVEEWLANYGLYSEITEEIIFAKKRELIELEKEYQKQKELKEFKKISEDGAEKIAIYRNALIESGIPADLADKMILTAVNASNGNSSFDKIPF